MTDRPRNPAARRQEIQRELSINGSASVDALARHLNSSVATIRRDLAALEEEGLIQRTHGGAMLRGQRGADQAFALREQIDSNAKHAIASKAAEMVEPDQTVLLNDGSTVLALARQFAAAARPLTVITPGVNVATCLSECQAISTYLLGGQLRHKTLGTSGSFAEKMLEAFNADTAFISAEGLSAREGLTFSYETDATLARLMSENSTRTVVLATKRKLAERDRITALPIEALDVLITDADDPDLIGPFLDRGVEVVVAKALDAERTFQIDCEADDAANRP